MKMTATTRRKFLKSAGIVCTSLVVPFVLGARGKKRVYWSKSKPIPGEKIAFTIVGSDLSQKENINYEVVLEHNNTRTIVSRGKTRLINGEATQSIALELPTKRLTSGTYHYRVRAYGGILDKLLLRTGESDPLEIRIKPFYFSA